MQEVLSKIGFDLRPLGNGLELRAGQFVDFGVHQGPQSLGVRIELLVTHMGQVVVGDSQIPEVGFSSHFDVDGFVVPDPYEVTDILGDLHRHDLQAVKTLSVNRVSVMGLSSNIPSSLAIWTIPSICWRVHSRR